MIPRASLFPAVPVPMFGDRKIDWHSQDRLAKSIIESKAAGVAVWAHTGRGLLLGRDDRNALLRHWRSAMPDKTIIAGVGADRALQSDALVCSAIEMADDALSFGADMLLCHPPRPSSKEETLIYYARLSALGKPLILFYLYPDAGGSFYDDDTLRELLSLPNVAGIKLATLNDVMRYQAVAQLVRTEFPNVTLITGEDRFLGYSIMAGARVGLLGMSAIFPSMQQGLFAAFESKDYPKFHQLSAICDEIGKVIFSAPMEGYIGRLLYALAQLGVINAEASGDSFGPALTQSDHNKINQLLQNMPAFALEEYA